MSLVKVIKVSHSQPHQYIQAWLWKHIPAESSQSSYQGIAEQAHSEEQEGLPSIFLIQRFDDCFNTVESTCEIFKSLTCHPMLHCCSFISLLMTPQS